jgi:hypothetical protein
MKRTGGIVATILTSLLCGLPGIGLICFALVGLLGTQISGVTSPAGTGMQNTMLGAVLYIGGGVLLMIIPIVVGILTLRNKRTLAPVASASAYAAPDQLPYVPPAQVVQPQPVHIPAPAPQRVAMPSQPAAVPVPGSGPSQDVYARLMGLNRPTTPYRIIDGRSENVDLIAEWKIVDAQWYEIFAKANLTKVFRIYLKLDPARREVRAMDREYTLQWRAGVPSLSVEASFFKGQKSSISFGTGYAFTETLAPGQVYKYKFNTKELKKPIQDTVTACGWTYKGVAFGKL